MNNRQLKIVIICYKFCENLLKISKKYYIIYNKIPDGFLGIPGFARERSIYEI